VAAGKRKQTRPKEERTTFPDEAGAHELARRVAANLRDKRKGRGMSLEDLAQASGVSRAALSQIETQKTNPTVGILWKIATGLGVPFNDLLGQPKTGINILRRQDSQVLRSLDAKFESRPLTPVGASPLCEIYELRLAPRSRHVAEPHAPGTHEFVVVLGGQLKMVVADAEYTLSPGDTISFAADVPHAYDNPGAAEARYHNVILYER